MNRDFLTKNFEITTTKSTEKEYISTEKERADSFGW